MGTSTLPPLPRTLILDYYDSYTNNLLTLFTRLYSDAEVLRKVVVVKADRYTWDEFKRDVLPNIDCVILSPGPGSPDKPSDIGFALDLLRLHPVPILGVCLGHQAIGVAFGAKIVNIPQITHGHVVPIAPVQPALGLFASPIWRDVASQEGEGFDVVVYNSLVIDHTDLPDDLVVTAWSVPKNGTPATVQGLAHKSFPIWGVQYHPESISSTRGKSLLHAFLDAVNTYHSTPSSYPPLNDCLKAACSYRVASATRSTSRPGSTRQTPAASRSGSPSGASATKPSLRMVERRLAVGQDLKTQEVFERVIRSRKGKERAVGEVWLDGDTPTRPTTTSLTAPPFLFAYSLASRTVSLHTPSCTHTLPLDAEESFWDLFSDAQTELSSSTKLPGRGWRGGWVGWFGYEMKEESMPGYHRSADAASKPEAVDACWAWSNWVLERTTEGEWIVRGLIDDSVRGDAPVQGRPNGLVEWLQQLGITPGLTSAAFDALASDIGTTLSTCPAEAPVQPADHMPRFKPNANGDLYQSRIDQCRESIRQGDSYELTMTTSFHSQLSDSEDPYALYLRLRAFNPAYYSTWLSFPFLSGPDGRGIHILSSSPERFLKIERQGAGRTVEMMPIKGTQARVKPGQCVCVDTGCKGLAPGSPECIKEGRLEDERRGQALQADVKERAENLMIVDLIRSDLLSCCLPSTVVVPKLIALESYGVHHLVTTVRGSLAENVNSVEAVRRCFPPGSMTGAPKLRSVQLLEGYEGQRRRGVYSGALGYISVDGATDLSVVIRTIVVQGNEMSIGAGGAITWLSKRANEWEEVKTKVRSVVGTLDD